ncbi:(2Fe-2S)-binding protein [Cupriavidus taiwanensis]|uniref:4-hydroxybenzoyl-CoA reductase HbaB subunit n=2 Tax=Cupriavidus taiwanensis TaxID=164546 RepID=B3R8T4_CUPTR|nr:(2Fe-2S)-binding protein [Cupriavidus taiwanensis]CAQ71202.1 4-hydroxybenzoyl-CoA reductase HbaB subunit [Cupriavidus taiwanensis LMG 19424]SOY71574.1 4-hydroxybenzoyl-CoA reductase HbaB subunit [Cupriavidus taiwanensis]SOZ09925.1 4-hydroxybenzoyl-CoA reductase HbaB subunit [Cupriavidus taiwanensis]SOZ12039.1 4-hydroxybenzoyl-CoA reductase HbaB subunit [Cupriavidus taiwanensis]SOZ43398.1 4-hydroxybenzoyl-CoA reductase HbaB subunit [Cupriavidus taiwanensis]
MNPVTIELTVNGEEHQVQAPARRLLADLLRDDLNLTGTKRGCETGICGACSVLVDGEVVKSCLMLAVQARGRHVMTVEGLAADGQLHPLQQCFMDRGGLQCGYCTPGFLMASCALLANNPNPTEEDVRHGLNGNLCRCTGYVGIVESVLSAAEAMRGN